MKSICDTLFDLLRSSELPQKPWHHNQNKRKRLKQPQSNFHWVIPHRSHHFSMFSCMLYMATPDISSSRENINSTARVSRVSFRFLWLSSNELKHADVVSAHKTRINVIELTIGLTFQKFMRIFFVVNFMNTLIIKFYLTSQWEYRKGYISQQSFSDLV